MGLFSFFGSKAKDNEVVETNEETLNLSKLKFYSDIRVEVNTLKDELLFVAKFIYIKKNTAQLYQYSEVSIPPNTESMRVKIRGYVYQEKKAIYMEGIITPKPDGIWLAENLVLTKVNNDRAFFRINTDIDSIITNVNGIDKKERECKVINISVGGVCVCTEDIFYENDKFLLKVKLLAEREPSVMYCQVLRITKRSGYKYEYGCKFLGLSEVEQDKITQNIFAVQRKKGNFI